MLIKVRECLLSLLLLSAVVACSDGDELLSRELVSEGSVERKEKRGCWLAG